MEWINIDDQMPPQGEWILTYGKSFERHDSNSHVMVTRLSEQGNFDILSSGCGCCDDCQSGVTHWMFLPKAPETNENYQTKQK